MCKVRDNNGKRKTFSIGSNFAFVCTRVYKGMVNEVVYAVVRLFRLRLCAIGLLDKDTYCVIGNIKILSLCCRHHAVIKGVIAGTHIAAYRSKPSMSGKQDRNVL